MALIEFTDGHMDGGIEVDEGAMGEMVSLEAPAPAARAAAPPPPDPVAA